MRYAEFLLNRVARMFVFDGLPESIDPNFVSRELLVHGRVGITKETTDGAFETPRAWRGWCGGAVTAEYTGSLFIGSSPVLGSTVFTIGEGGGVIFNSSEDRFAPFSNDAVKIGKRGKWECDINALPYTALYEYIMRTADLLNQIDISIRSLLRSSRATFFVTAKTDQIRQAAEIALKKILNGDDSVIFQSDLLESLKFDFAPTAANAASLMKELKEEYQFILAQYYHAIGVNSNYNLKRERLNEAEIDLNEDALLVNISDMLKSREEGCEQVNSIFGTNLRVRLGDEWQKERNETEPEGGEDNNNGGSDNSVGMVGEADK